MRILVQDKLKHITLFFLAVTIFIYVCFVLVAGTEYYNYCSIAALLLGIALTTTQYKDFDNRASTDCSGFILKFSKRVMPISYAIVFGNAFLGVCGYCLLFQKVDFSDSETIKEILIVTSGLGVVVSQIGGWILQSLLICLLCIFLGLDIHPKFVFNIVAIAYTGFFVVTSILICLNLTLLPSQISVHDLNGMVFASPWYVISGKTGEFFTLAVIFYGLLHLKRIRVLEAMIASAVPSILLLAFSLIAQQILRL